MNHRIEMIFMSELEIGDRFYDVQGNLLERSNPSNESDLVKGLRGQNALRLLEPESVVRFAKVIKSETESQEQVGLYEIYGRSIKVKRTKETI